MELHDAGIAHMDIRLENICFLANGDAILIDVDRSCMKTSSANSTAVKYGKSTMYTRNKGLRNWTAENLHWRQVAIMLKSIVCTELRYYHEIEVKPEDSGFLYELYNNG